MAMPVVVGVIIALMFLITFSGWFYEFASGLHELVLDDMFFSYRIIGASVISILILGGSFYTISLVNQCPRQEREGIFAGLNCDSYLKLKSSADLLFAPKNEPVNNSFQ